MAPPTGYASRMASASTPYDPESEDEDARTSSRPVASTSAVLGYSDGLVGRSGDLTDWRTSRIGGAPVGLLFFFTFSSAVVPLQYRPCSAHIISACVRFAMTVRHFLPWRCRPAPLHLSVARVETPCLC